MDEQPKAQQETASDTMIMWGIYSTQREAEERIASEKYSPGRLSWEERVDQRTGRKVYVVRLAYNRHLPQVGKGSKRKDADC